MAKCWPRLISLVGLLGALFFLSFLGPDQAQGAPKNQVYLDQEFLITEEPIFNIDGRTMMSYRDLFQALGGKVSWDATSRLATAHYGDQTFVVDPDRGTITSKGKTKALRVPPQFINDRIYLPLRWFGENLGYDVDYHQDDQANNIITLSRQKADFATVDGTYLHFPFQAQGEGSVYYLDQDLLVEVCREDGYLRQTTLNLATGDQADKTLPISEDVQVKAPYRCPDGSLAYADNDQGFFHYDGFHGILYAGDYLGYGEAYHRYGNLESDRFRDHPLYLTQGAKVRVTGTGDKMTLVQETIDQGLLVDISQFWVKDGSRVDYTLSDKGNMALLIDDRLILLRKDSFEVAKEIEDFGGQAIQAQGDVYYTYGFEGAKVLLGKVEEYGRTNTFTRPIYTFPQEGAEVVAAILDGHKLTALAKDTTRCYATTYDLKDGKTTSWTLPHQVTFSQLLLGEEGLVAAFGHHKGQAHLYYLT